MPRHRPDGRCRTSCSRPAATSGVDNIDLWMGGLAEKPQPVRRPAGPDLQLRLRDQLESLQNADRFYYLERLDGLNLLSQLEANSFAELIQRNTTAGRACPADVFSRPGPRVQHVGPAPDRRHDRSTIRTADVDDPTSWTLVEQRGWRASATARSATPAAHVIFNGRRRRQRPRSSRAKVTTRMRGNGGDDRIEGGAGNDQHIGGAGDDILTDIVRRRRHEGRPRRRRHQRRPRLSTCSRATKATTSSSPATTRRRSSAAPATTSSTWARA